MVPNRGGKLKEDIKKIEQGDINRIVSSENVNILRITEEDGLIIIEQELERKNKPQWRQNIVIFEIMIIEEKWKEELMGFQKKKCLSGS